MHREDEFHNIALNIYKNLKFSSPEYLSKIMNKKIISIVATSIFALSLTACTATLNRTSKIVFAPKKINNNKENNCTFNSKPNDIKRPARGIIEGNGSFLTPSWELYVIDLDAKKLSKIESVWTFEGGQMSIKPNRTDTIDLNSSELHAVVALANSIWASPTDNPSHFMTDVSWHIDLVDGAEKKCQSGLGEATGDGGLLTNTVYAIWKFHRKPEK
ncbi:hypothetical protein [Paraburkholderia domus]|uniref:Uncharacterized protein n=1 Tax=Paraburkholderia domus TaxID=2793075 RepID=A0A9N8MU12_9BURK|nr:hypothetical protein [Paraburkholderia domus]MBK5164655.1 hypothetical protein [Burkholderia sp. R-70211]MBK5181908.1 hypothetical protein [Burkholderia sp. R-69749]MCI0147884.1 hypothetical protein [Paraburkholderia sediminicola]CAE6837664.1 hypothetical protein R69749_04308 [Paraburkholderia domus]CAE6874140.1 hypothetical protein R70211_01526 [Paraburkholderia domus]